LTRSVTPDGSRHQGVDLKRKTAEVSSGRALSIEEAARKDSAVHVSLSSDSPVKQPGDLAIPALGEAKGRRSSRHPTEIGGLFTGISEELRRRDLTPRRRRAVGSVYRLGTLTLSTP
jgi:hypothetical protein